ncbi:hypothetical protein DPEC_G00026580 [Dallia pectoralis]|uniref:Uncharacterized protein n=1 Tax=Dallia pectoralis TaxID=75939 RepID=A0ACC2HIB5_DALPE|nr:hypothetical protein DPEC_G00026580 [Dallia pectoralis]
MSLNAGWWLTTHCEKLAKNSALVPVDVKQQIYGLDLDGIKDSKTREPNVAEVNVCILEREKRTEARDAERRCGGKTRTLVRKMEEEGNVGVLIGWIQLKQQPLTWERANHTPSSF